MRALIWLLVIAVAVLGRLLHNEVLSVLAEPLALVLLCWLVPPALRVATAGIAAGMLLVLVLGGSLLALQTLPVFFACWIGWLFARSLLGTRMPLVARVMCAIDGREFLADPAAARYAWRVTALWAAALGAFAVYATLCVLHAHSWLPFALPSPQVNGVLLPLLSLLLFVGEFALRRWLLPQAPAHSLLQFVRDMVRIWPDLLDDEAPRQLPLS